MKKSLLILAAGMGSRYGGLKQMEGFGPNGETLMDYSVEDAVKAGFGRAVFVIRRDFAAAFSTQVLSKYRGKLDVEVAFQDLEDLPPGFAVPEGRSKPWGTAHAVLAARRVLDGPFVMVNADDFYGPESFRALSAFFDSHRRRVDCAMAAYRVAATLSEHGGVTRAICQMDEKGYLSDMQEAEGLSLASDGVVRGSRVAIEPDAPVSMNCFGFQGDFLALLEQRFAAFMERHGQELKSECLIPNVVGELVRAAKIRVKVLRESGTWFGVTHPDDKPRVMAELKRLHDAGRYAQGAVA